MARSKRPRNLHRVRPSPRSKRLNRLRRSTQGLPRFLELPLIRLRNPCLLLSRVQHCLKEPSRRLRCRLRNKQFRNSSVPVMGLDLPTLTPRWINQWKTRGFPRNLLAQPEQTRFMPFHKFGLSSAMLEGVKAMGYIEPTPIQLRAIPLIMAGQDVIGSAQTGTGKTAAFALPILSKLGHHEARPRVLILEPTRELAAQVETAVRDFA